MQLLSLLGAAGCCCWVLLLGAAAGCSGCCCTTWLAPVAADPPPALLSFSALSTLMPAPPSIDPPHPTSLRAKQNDFINKFVAFNEIGYPPGMNASSPDASDVLRGATELWQANSLMGSNSSLTMFSNLGNLW